MPRLFSLVTRIPSNFVTHSKNTTHLSSLPFAEPTPFLSSPYETTMNKVAVIGCGISGAVCGTSLASRGFSVTIFESGRRPGGRTSQRREITEDGKELFFDHGAPFFTVHDDDVMTLVSEWEARGFVAEWKENFGCFDQTNAKFIDVEKEELRKKYVGIPGMNSICKALCSGPGVEAKFGSTVGKLEWLEGRKLWLLTGLDGQSLGHFDAVVVTDKILVSPRFTGLTGKPPPLDLNLVPEFATMLQDVPVHPCFALMLAFSEPLSSMPMKGFSVKDSEVLSWAFCDSSKPGRSLEKSECWVLRSTAEYAEGVINRTGVQKPSSDTLQMVALEMFQAFQMMGLDTPQPFFMKAHRWGSAFPAIAVARKDKCLWDQNKMLAVCGDFCVSPSVEGAVLSGKQAAEKLVDLMSSL